MISWSKCGDKYKLHIRQIVTTTFLCGITAMKILNVQTCFDPKSWAVAVLNYLLISNIDSFGNERMKIIWGF